MRVSKNWKDFELLDTSAGERLERWGEHILIRPDPQVIWDTPRLPVWKQYHARYERSRSGGGSWQNRSLKETEWITRYGNLQFRTSPTGFKHVGLFPEQAVNWDWMTEKIRQASAEGRKIRVINLFAYTGGATLACAAAGAEVCHVDAAKGMVAWARRNAELSGLSDRPVRWIVDDCKKFVERRLRRGEQFDAVIMDPPSYGRGPGGEVWKLEDSIYDLVKLVAGLLSPAPLFFLLNSYSTGLSASVMAYLLGSVLLEKHGGAVHADEIGLPVTGTGLALPCGSTAIWELV